MTVASSVSSEPEGPAGYTYAAVMVRVKDDVASSRPDASEEVLSTLRRIRFTGWAAPAEKGWVTAVAAGAGTIAAGRRDVVGVGEAVAEATVAPTLVVRVLGDRQLVVVAWESGQEVVRYVSDPSREPRAGADVLADPYGVESADALAAVCGRPDAGEELGELLAEPLDPDEEIESERLGRMLRLLDLPSWPVAAWRLPRPMPTGPASRDLLRLGAGRTGPIGWVAGRAATLVRRWRRPPPVLDQPPRADGGEQDPLMWL